MDILEARALAWSLITEHGLIPKGWSFQFDHAKKRAGCCWYTGRRITLSYPLTKVNDDAVVKNTILHEIAHALVFHQYGPNHGHDRVWKSVAKSIGCSGDTYTRGGKQVEGRWVLVCPHCHKEFHRHKRPTRMYWHSDCRRLYGSSCGIMQVIETSTWRSMQRTSESLKLAAEMVSSSAEQVAQEKT